MKIAPNYKQDLAAFTSNLSLFQAVSSRKSHITPKLWSLLSLLLVGLGCAKNSTSIPGNLASESKPPVLMQLDFPPNLPCPLAGRGLVFDPQAKVVSADEIALALWAATYAYAAEADVRAALLAHGFTAVEFIDASLDSSKQKTGLQAYVAMRPGLRIVAVRGSSEALDWVSNADDSTRPGAEVGLPGWIHAGYSKQLASGWDSIQAALAKGPEIDPILVTGHSLGGAVASLLGVRLARSGAPLGHIISFAAPRAGDTEFAQAVQKQLGQNYVRVVRADDPVPRLPVSAANAQLGASLASPGGGLSKIASDTLKFSLTHYEHAGVYLSVDPINGSLKPQSAPTDQEEAAVLKDRLNATLKAITAGKEAKAAFDTQESGNHAPLAYMCPIFMPK